MRKNSLVHKKPRWLTRLGGLGEGSTAGPKKRERGGLELGVGGGGELSERHQTVCVTLSNSQFRAIQGYSASLCSGKIIKWCEQRIAKKIVTFLCTIL